jgi:hypothetical protein
MWLGAAAWMLMDTPSSISVGWVPAQMHAFRLGTAVERAALIIIGRQLQLRLASEASVLKSILVECDRNKSPIGLQAI